jgi:cytochrome bd-type quinol oxidase subunit 2
MKFNIVAIIFLLVAIIGGIWVYGMFFKPKTSGVIPPTAPIVPSA